MFLSNVHKVKEKNTKKNCLSLDINECQINNHDCLDTQRCDNTIGSYTCIRLQSCGTGYTLNAESGNCDGNSSFWYCGMSSTYK